MKTLLLLTLLLIFTGCAGMGSKYNGEAQAPQDAPLVQRNYVVRDRSHSKRPLWAYDFMKFQDEREAKKDKFRYFKADSGDVNDKVAGCDMARGRAKRKLAEEVASNLKSLTNETAEGRAVINKMDANGSDGLNRTFQSFVEQKANEVLAGVREVAQVWEERDYSQADGAASVYNCQVLVKVPKKRVKRMVDRVIKLVFKSQPKVRAQLKDAPQQIADGEI